jgi:type I restriction enzyme S subunit
VKAIETQKVQAQGSLVKAEELFNSLLQRAFKGELV